MQITIRIQALFPHQRELLEVPEDTLEICTGGKANDVTPLEEAVRNDGQIYEVQAAKEVLIDMVQGGEGGSSRRLALPFFSTRNTSCAPRRCALLKMGH